MVKPPVGRFHESLWEIAQKYLGDGRRYREIFDLNSGRVQPDGSRLTIASLIRPGWVLHMPRDAHGPWPRGHARGGQPAAAAAPAPGPRPARRRHRAGAHGRPGSTPGAGSTAGRGEHARSTPRGARRAGEHGHAGEHGRAGEHAGTPGSTGRAGEHAPRRRDGTPEHTARASTGHVRRSHWPRRASTAARGGAGPAGEDRPLPAAGRRQRFPRRRDSCTPGASATRTSWPRPRSWPPGSWPPWAANAASNCGSAPSAAGWSPRKGGRRWPNPRCGPGRTSRPPGCSTAGCAISPARWRWRGGPRPPWSRLTSATRTWTCGWRPRTWTRLRRGPPWATARCGGCRSPRSGGSTWTRSGDALALFPGLVSLGTDRTGRVLVNLEAAHGVISVTGPQDHDHRGAVRDGHGTGHQPLVRPDAHHAGRFRRRPDRAGAGPDHRGAHPGRRRCPPWKRTPLDVAEAMAGVGGELRAGRAAHSASTRTPGRRTT